METGGGECGSGSHQDIHCIHYSLSNEQKRTGSGIEQEASGIVTIKWQRFQNT